MSNHNPTVIPAPPGLVAVLAHVNEQGVLEYAETPILVLHAFYERDDSSSQFDPEKSFRLQAVMFDSIGQFQVPEELGHFAGYHISGNGVVASLRSLDPVMVETAGKAAMAAYEAMRTTST